eukprot:TRINITY_DN42238_c0_g1_i1.p1 TRINITY_DN42238_c0_g1~~TRINITY_DN42238_c0_g1_i1.p1  ORF type:complete len:402 (+),score=131.60 TRINITY_DN42238_c0_g1_i1:48-1208(+)
MAACCSDTTADVEGEEGVTMVDVLHDEQALEADANAVLGDVSDTACTYPLGYLPRQPVYACNTCSEPEGGGKPAGVCLACSYHCHEGHNLVELYTKRQLRCDCGSNKLKTSCKLEPSKEENTENKYNQNFSGLYCTCSRPYPDQDDPVEDCMIQCVVCEDWYHGRHTGMGQGGPPDDSSFAEMICAGCVARLPYLQFYSGLAVSKVEKEDAGADAAVNVEKGEGAAKEVKENVEPLAKSGVDVPADANASSVDTVCPLTKPSPNIPLTSSMFLPMGWRSALCKCSSCSKLYLDTKTTFLTQETDTVHHYESQARERKGTLEQGMEALSQLDRVKQVEAIHSYNNMKENLMEYLTKFADNKKVVREDDIKTFFEGMKGNKKFKPSLL